MAGVARKMVEDAGVDVDNLLDKLVANASAEFTTFLYYTHFATTSPGWTAKESKK